MVNLFEQDILVPCYDTDAAMLLKPASFMNYAQEAANRHAAILGFGYDDLQVTKTFWVLSRMHVKFLKHPRWRDNIKFQTWHKGPERLFYLRDFKISDEKNEPMVLATTSWLVLNVDTRRIVRDAGLDPSTARTEHAIEQSCDKVAMPSDADRTLAATHKVSYSDLDLNGHVNNAIYLVWSMDTVNSELSMNKPLKEMLINFNHEIRPQETVDLYTAYAEEDGSQVCYVEGMIRPTAAEEAPRQAFCVKLIF